MGLSEERAGWLVLATVILGTFLGSMDRTVVNLALPDIITTFNLTISTAGWIATAYILANAALVPIWGKLGDKIGRKKIYLGGLGIFIVGSLLAGISWNFSSLIIFRIIQAIAASASYPTSMAILTVTFKDGRKRAQALGIWSASLASGAILGPLIGGPLIDAFGWRSIFFLNIPLGFIGILMAILFIEESSSKKKNIKFDISGSIIMAIGLSSLVLVLEEGNTWGWSSLSSIVSYLITLISFAVFYFIEKHSEDPIIDFKFFKNRTFVVIIINTFMVFMGLMGAMFLIPLFAETFLGYSATTTGYLFIPMAFVLMAAAIIGAKLSNKMKPERIISWGTFIAALGFFLLSYLDPRSTSMDIIIPLSVMAFGMGLGMSHRTNIIASSAPEDEIGSASSLFVLFRNIAGAFGVAIFTTILSSHIENNILNTAKNTIINLKSPIILHKVASLIILKSQVSAYSTVFTISSIFVFIGGIAAFFIKTKNKS